MRDVEMQVRDYWSGVVAEHPVPSAAELMEWVASLDSAFDSAEAEAEERRGDDLLVDYLQQRPGESNATTERIGLRGAVVAVVATILVVVGVVVVADGNSGDVATDPVTSPTVADPVPAPTVADPVPPPSVVDSLGYRWSRVPHDEAVFGEDGESFMNGVIAGGPGLVAVGRAGSDRAVWTSVDGIVWSRVPHDEAVFGGDGGQLLGIVTAGGPGLVAIGVNDAGAAVLWTSIDGFSWKRVSGDVFEGGSTSEVIAGGPGLVAVGETERGAAVWTSVDGLAWSRVPHDEAVFGDRVGDNGDGMTAVTVGGPGLVAVGSEGRDRDNPSGRAYAVVWTSVDGLTWSRVPHDESVFGGAGDQEMLDVAVGGPGLVAVGVSDAGAAVWTSVDGITWSRVPHDEAAFEVGYAITSVIATSEGLVAPGDGGAGWIARVWTSRDGTTWARVDDEALFGAVRISDVIVGGPGLVAVGAVGGPGQVAGAGTAGVWVATLEN